MKSKDRLDVDGNEIFRSTGFFSCVHDFARKYQRENFHLSLQNQSARLTAICICHFTEFETVDERWQMFSEKISNK